MIAITLADGTLLRGGLTADGQTFGFHQLFGFISETACDARLKRRKRAGVRAAAVPWLCRFVLEPVEGGAWQLGRVEGAQIEQVAAGVWKLVTEFGSFLVSETSNLDAGRLLGEPTQDLDFSKPALAIAAALLLWFMLFPSKKEEAVAPPILEPVTVKMPVEIQRPVSVNPIMAQVTSKIDAKNEQGRRAVEQNLGFLKLLGRKDLSKAIGGVPSALKDVSPGVGVGGNAGSGGELLVGLGQGVKRTTVGNSGVAGLGGVGKSGAGGGAGGYGDSLVGSGEGRSLTKLGIGNMAALSKDIVLEGGLDRSVIQATIAKYLSQVRACYEEGLRRNPGLTGSVMMNFEVGGQGDVNYARVGKSSLGDQPVEQCISARMLGWKFPKPLGGVNVKVAYPFLLRPVNS